MLDYARPTARTGRVAANRGQSGIAFKRRPGREPVGNLEDAREARLQNVGQLREDPEGDVAATRLDLVEIGPVNADLPRDLPLSEPLGETKPPELGAYRGMHRR